MKSRDMTATPTSTGWILPETELAQWLRNGNLWLRLSFKLRLLMDTSLECSALPSQRRHTNRLRRPATQKHPIRRLSEGRWWKLCSLRYKRTISRISWRSYLKNRLEKTFRKNAAEFSHFKTTAWSERWRFLRSPSSISLNWWSFTRTSPTTHQRGLPTPATNFRTPEHEWEFDETDDNHILFIALASEPPLSFLSFVFMKLIFALDYSIIKSSRIELMLCF